MARLVVERREVVELDFPLHEVLAGCRRALADLGWETLAADDVRLVAMEVPFRMDCLSRPAAIEVRLRATTPTTTSATLQGSIHGVGQRAARRLEAQIGRVRNQLLARLG